MNDQDKLKAAKIIDKIYERMLEGNLTWEETSDKKAYQNVIGNYTLQLVKDYDHESEEEFVKVLFRKYDGTLIDEIMPGYLSNIDSSIRPNLFYWQIFEEMYETARRQALGVDKAYDELLSLL